MALADGIPQANPIANKIIIKTNLFMASPFYTQTGGKAWDLPASWPWLFYLIYT
jgi:hypothetical protein